MRGHLAALQHRQENAREARKKGRVIDPMAIATCNSTLLTAKELSQEIEPLKQSIKAVTMGRGTFADWVRLCSAYNVAMAIEHFGVVRGYKEALDELRLVLDAVGVRGGGDAKNWKSPALHSHEMKVLRMQAADYKFQLGQLSYGEYKQAYDRAVNKVRSGSGEVFEVGALQ